MIHDNQFNVDERQFLNRNINQYTTLDDYLYQFGSDALDTCDNEDLDRLKSDNFYRSDDDDVCVFDADDNQFMSAENNNKEKRSEFQSNSSNQQTINDRPPDTTELSVMLIFLWRRHSLSKAAMNDICRIFNFFNIPNMPKDFRGVVSNVKRHNSTLFHGNHSFICPSCCSKSSNISKCLNNQCESALSYIRTPTSVFTFPLVSQISSILEREKLMSPTYRSDECNDIFNSRRHQEIIISEKQKHPNRKIITLTLHNDGVLVKRISRSLWITCACINELPRTKRYETNNLLMCSISMGSEKPKKKEYAVILKDIVYELKILEDIGFDIFVPSDNRHEQTIYTHFHAFTISAVCDKPAHSLIMNIKDATGFFSCGWCCIPGE